MWLRRSELTQLAQHMRECDLRWAAVERRLDDHDTTSKQMHSENQRRIDSINRLLITIMLSVIAGLATAVWGVVERHLS